MGKAALTLALQDKVLGSFCLSTFLLTMLFTELSAFYFSHGGNQGPPVFSFALGFGAEAKDTWRM